MLKCQHGNALEVVGYQSVSVGHIKETQPVETPILAIYLLFCVCHVSSIATNHHGNKSL